MACHGVQRLHFAAVAGRGSGIDEGLGGLAQVGLDLAYGLECLQRLAQFKVGLEMAGLFLAAHRLAGRLPGLQSTIEHCHGIVAGPAQHPPQAAAVIGGVAVIDHGLHIVGKAYGRQPGGKALARGQGVAAAGGRLHAGGDLAVFAGCSVRCAEVFVQIGEQGAIDMDLQILLAAGRRIHEVKAAVKHHQGLAAGLEPGQLFDGNQGVVVLGRRVVHGLLLQRLNGCRRHGVQSCGMQTIMRSGRSAGAPLLHCLDMASRADPAWTARQAGAADVHGEGARHRCHG